MKALEGFFQGGALDESHHVAGNSTRVFADPVDGDDPRVLHLRRDLGLLEEPRPANGVHGVRPLEELDGDESPELVVPGLVNDP